MKYYDVGPLWATGCNYMFCVSGRGPGKTTAVTKLLIDNFCDSREQFTRLVRFDWACGRSIMGRWFNSVAIEHLREKPGYENAYIDYYGMEYRIHPDGTDDYQIMGYVVPLNAQDDYKPAAQNASNIIVFEEFALNRERDYIQDEIELFLSALSTIVRHRQDPRIIFIGNTISKHNPYFDWLGIDVDTMMPTEGRIKTYRVQGFEGKGATVALELAAMGIETIEEISPVLRVTDNDIAITGGYSQDPAVVNYKQICACTSDRDYTPLLRVDGLYMGAADFCTLEVTKRPMYDNMHILRCKTLDAGQWMRGTWLNLSGELSPYVDIDTYRRYLDCYAPDLITAAPELRREIVQAHDSCVHAYETDRARYAWEGFVDACRTYSSLAGNSVYRYPRS